MKVKGRRTTIKEEHKKKERDIDKRNGEMQK